MQEEEFHLFIIFEKEAINPTHCFQKSVFEMVHFS